MCKRVKLLTLVLAWLLGVLPMAAGTPCELALLGIGGQNRTWAGYGGGAIQASLPIWKNVDIQSGFQGLSSGVMTGLLQVQPVFPSKKGSLFADVTGYYGGFYKNSINEWLTAGSIGWRNEHISAQIGLSVRWIMDRESSEKVVEPLDLFYRIAYRLKAADAPWNLTGGVANYSRYQVGRATEPVFFLEGCYHLGERLSLIGELDIKPTGMFHLVAAWYGFSAGIGLSYRFAL